jgi:hypothetical protein
VSNLFAKSWEFYRQNYLPKNLDAKQLANAKNLFYAGAASFSMSLRASTDMNETYISLHTELIMYGESVVAEKLRGTL